MNPCQHVPQCPPGFCPQPHDPPAALAEVLDYPWLHPSECLGCGTTKEWRGDENDYLVCPIASWWPPQ